MKTRRQITLLLAVLFISTASADVVELAGQGFIPEPNQEITVQIQTDIPLFCMETIINVNGDANIISAMSPADCNQYGWGIDWPVDSYIDDVNNEVYFGGVSWMGEANGIVGYFKFRYSSGQVTVSIIYGFAADANCQLVEFSDKTLVFGELGTQKGEMSEELSVSAESEASCEQSAMLDVLQSSSSEPIQDEPNELLTRTSPALSLNEPHLLLVSCPNDNFRPYRLEEFAHYSISEKNLESLIFPASGGSSYVELQEITSSQFLDPNVTYYVPYPPLLIHGVGGEEIDVVIPSDTTIVLAEVWDYGIVVYDGANVQFGEPAPRFNEPNVIYEPNDVNNPVPPVRVIGESSSPFFNNYCGIFIDRTAGTRCKLDNIYLNGFYYGLLVDQQLDQPISNIHIFGCYDGIISFGPNRIINSSVSYYGVWSSGWQYYGFAYCFLPESWDESIIFEGADFEIYNCLADDGDDGFTVYGLDEPYETPNFYSSDCAATNSYSGFNGWNGNVAFSIICPGLYNNYQDKNFPELPFTDPVYEVNNPFVTTPNDYRIFLHPDSQFVNHGSGLTPFLGWTTNINGTPDDGIGDIWPHYQARKAELLSADLNSDHVVDVNDLAEFTDRWLIAGSGPADLNKDGIVNLFDFSVFANQWQKTEMFIELVDVETGNNIDPNNISGYVGIRLKNIPVSGEMVTVYIDNVQIGGWLSDLSDRDRLISFESDSFSNGWHTIRLVSMDIYGNVINHKPVNVYFNNLLYKVAGEDYFHPDEDYKFSGFYDGSSTLEANITNMDGQVIWSDTYSGPHVSIVIPGTTFGDEQFCKLSIAEMESAMMAGVGGPGPTVGSTTTEIDLTKEFRQEDCPAGVKMVIVLPNKDIFTVRKPAIFECANACNKKGVSWVALCYHNVTEDNLQFLYKKSSVKYIYWCGHANSHVGRDEESGILGVQRTNVVTYRKIWMLGIPWPETYYKEILALSYTTQTVPGAEPLPDDWDNRGFDLGTIRVEGSGYKMSDSWNKRIVFVDACLSAVFPDMAYAYGMFSLQGQGSKDQIYIGWRIVVEEKKVLDIFAGDTTKGVKLFWERMGRNDENSVKQALQYTCDHPISGPMLITMWGLNLKTDFGDVGEDDGIFVWGQGFVNLNQIKLEP